MSALTADARELGTTAAPSRVVLWLSLLAVLASLVSTALLLLRPDWPVLTSLPQLALALNTALAPALICVAGARWLSESTVLSRGRAVTAACLSVLAFCASAAAAASFSVGFDEADAGDPRSSAGALALPLAIVAWALGATALAVTLDAVVTRVMRKRASEPASPTPRLLALRVLAALAGVVGAIVIGVSLFAMGGGLVAAVGLLVAVLLAAQRSRTPATPASTGTSRAEHTGTATKLRAVAQPGPIGRGPVLLAGISAILGIGAAAFAFTGREWGLPAPFGGPAFDQTEAMQLGLAIAALVSLPLLASVGLAITRRRSPARAGLHVWVPLGLAAGALALYAIGAILAGAGGQNVFMWNMMIAGVGFLALSAAFVIWPRARALTLPTRIGVTVLLAAASAGIVGLPLLGMWGFVAPLLAVAAAFVIYPRLDRRLTNVAG